MIFISKLLVATLAGLALFAFAQPGAYAATETKIDCDKGGTIQGALDKAKNGDIISVQGFCTENVVILKDGIHLLADGVATIHAANSTLETILVLGRNIAIDGFIISGGKQGIFIDNTASATIANNQITDNTRGIIIFRASTGNIEDNVISGNGFDEDGEPIIRGHGIFIGLSSSATINRNVIDANGAVGVRFAEASSGRLSDNTITNNQTLGLDVSFNSSVRLSDGGGGPNLFEGNGGYGWQCQINSSIWPTENQNFGTGNNLSNTNIGSSCVKAGSFN